MKQGHIDNIVLILYNMADDFGGWCILTYWKGIIMGNQDNHPNLKLSSQRDNIQQLMSSLERTRGQEKIEKILYRTFKSAPENIIPNSNEYYAVLNYHLYRYILKHYKHKKDTICLWRYIKNLSDGQLNFNSQSNPELQMMDSLVRIYLFLNL